MIVDPDGAFTHKLNTIKREMRFEILIFATRLKHPDMQQDNERNEKLSAAEMLLFRKYFSYCSQDIHE